MSGFTGTTANISVRVQAYAAPTGSGVAGVSSVNGQGGAVTIESTGGTNTITEPSSGFINIEQAPNSTNQKIKLDNNGSLVGTRKEINLIPGTGITISATDNSSSDRVDVTINSTATGGVSSVNTLTGAVVLESTGSTINVTNPSGDNVNLDVAPNTTNQKVAILNNGSAVGTRKAINLIPGSNVTISATDNSGSDRVDVTINSTASGGGGGTVTSVTSANSDISVTNSTTTPTLTLNSSSTPSAGKVVKYDSNGNIETDNIQKAISKKTTNYTLLVTDHTVEFDTTSGPLTATLAPSASASGLEFVVSIVAGTHSLTLSAQSGELINGTNSWVVNNAGSALSVHCDGGGYSFT